MWFGRMACLLKCTSRQSQMGQDNWIKKDYGLHKFNMLFEHPCLINKITNHQHKNDKKQDFFQKFWNLHMML
jgi:hypothetical protein